MSCTIPARIPVSTIPATRVTTPGSAVSSTRVQTPCSRAYVVVVLLVTGHALARAGDGPARKQVSRGFQGPLPSCRGPQAALFKRPYCGDRVTRDCPVFFLKGVRATQSEALRAGRACPRSSSRRHHRPACARYRTRTRPGWRWAPWPGWGALMHVDGGPPLIMTLRPDCRHLVHTARLLLIDINTDVCQAPPPPAAVVSVYKKQPFST